MEDIESTTPTPGQSLADAWDAQALKCDEMAALPGFPKAVVLEQATFAAQLRDCARQLREAQPATDLAAQPPSPEPDGTVVIGTECFATADRRVISWRGINYYPWAADPDHQALPAPELAEADAYEADIASLTDQRNRVSATADQLRAQVRNLRDALERCRDAADRSPAAVHTIASQALASNPLPGGDQ